MYNDERHPPRPSKLSLVTDLVDQREQSTPHDVNLLVVHHVSKLINQAKDADTVIPLILRILSEMLGLNRGRVLTPEGDKVAIRYSYGLTELEHQRGIYAMGEGVSGKVMRTGQVAVVLDIDDEPDLLFRAVERSTLPKETVSYIAVPIISEGETIGVLGCHRLRNRMRSLDSDLIVLRILAASISMAMTTGNLLTDKEASKKGAAAQQIPELGTPQILGNSAALKSALTLVQQVAATKVAVLLNGESGTGKELFAQKLHAQSGRENKPFVAINCAAIPDQLLESELFGHERGAFTGAVSVKRGKIEMASGGTLFLDEIGDLNLELQVKLLRVLESNTIQRVGGVKPISVDVRIIAATHQDLMKAVNEGKFRLDLFYRLNIFPLQLPPLRARDGDIPILVKHFLAQANSEFGLTAVLSHGVMSRLGSYDWPGNIRQLINVIKRAVLMAGNSSVTVDIVEKMLADESRINRPTVPAATTEFYEQPEAFSKTKAKAKANEKHINARPYSWVREDEAETIKRALLQSGGNKTRAAEIVGMTARQLRYRMQKLGL